MRVPFSLRFQVPTSDPTFPVPPQEWHFRQSIDYSIACNRGVLDVASRMKENFLYNRYVMGRNSIERGSTDTWTREAASHRGGRQRSDGGRTRAWRGAGGRRRPWRRQRGDATWRSGRRCASRTTAIRAATSSRRRSPTSRRRRSSSTRCSRPASACTARRASSASQGKTYPAGSFVVLTAQAFRPHVIDMFEPQDHPDNFAYDGRAADAAVRQRRLDAGVPDGRRVRSHPRAVHRAVRGRHGLERRAAAGRSPTAAGSRFAAICAGAARRVRRGEPSARGGHAGRRGCLTATFVATLPANAARRCIGKLGAGSRRELHAVDRRGGAGQAGDAPAHRALGSVRRIDGRGWARWILEQFEFPFTRVFAPELDAGNLNAKFDTLIFVEGGDSRAVAAEAAAVAAAGGGGAGAGGRRRSTIPAEFQSQLGSITVGADVPQLKAFIEDGGTVVAIGDSATNLARIPGAADRKPSRRERRGDAADEVLRAGVGAARAHRHDAARSPPGMKEHTDFFFDNSPVWKLGPNAASAGVRASAWFDSKTPLRSAAGPGARRISTRASSPWTRPSARAARCCSARRSCSGRSRTRRSNFCSTGSTCQVGDPSCAESALIAGAVHAGRSSAGLRRQAGASRSMPP